MIDLIKTLLYEWKNRKLPEVIERDINLLEYADLKPNKIIVITGFRRSGKTYLTFHLIKELLKENSKEQVIYINFEDERIPLKTEFLTDLTPTIKKTFNEQLKFLFLDEVHNITNWSKWLRRIYDNEDIRIFITGSSSKMSSREIPTELRGRFLEVKIFPLNFKEFLRFKNISINLKILNNSEDEKIKIIKALNEYLKFGGMPEVILAPENKKSEIIHSYYNTLIRRDIIERFKIRNEESLKAILRLLLNSTSYSISKLYNNLKSLNFEVGKSTVQEYISHIENSYFIHSVPIFSRRVKDQLQYPRKVYFIDISFINMLSTRLSRDISRIYENVVFNELNKRLSHQEVYYWKSQQKEEVDFIIKQGLKVKQLIQVCYDIQDFDTKKREIKALIKASKELKCNNLLIITEDTEKEEKIDGKIVKTIPLWKWLLG